MNNLTKYCITVKNDQGKTRLIIVSVNGILGAVTQVTAAEACPEPAIIKIERISA